MRAALPAPDRPGEPDDLDKTSGPGEPPAPNGPPDEPLSPGSEPDQPGDLDETSGPGEQLASDGEPDEPLFLGDGAAGVEGLRAAADRVVAAVERWSAGGPTAGPCPDLPPDELAALVAGLDPCPDEAVPLDRVLDEVGERVLAHGVRPWHPWCAAHLHCPPLLAAAATELAIGATNQSMDSYDQAPAATLVEDRLVGRLAEILGLPAGSTGAMTAGGTASNLLGLALAREHAGRRGHAHDDGRRVAGSVADRGLPDGADRWRIVASAAAHFSVEQAAAVLGLGRRAVATVEVDDHGRMDVYALDATLARLDSEGHTTIAVVGTAGTTDAGAIDPLDALADRAAARNAWFHVDAAVGGALCLSDRLRPLVAGLGRADSVTTDLHKLWFQPIGASALLVRDPGAFDGLHCPSDYLDRAEDGELGVLNLVRRSLDTSRRFDALKVVVSLRSTGRRRMAALVEHLVDTAAATAEVIDRHPDLELLAPPSTVTVLFRWRPARPSARRLAAAHPAGPAAAQATRPEASVLDAAATGPDDTAQPASPVPDTETPDGAQATATVLGAAQAGGPDASASGAAATGPDEVMLDAVNTAVQRRLFATGRAVLGRTRWRGRVALKLTVVNPRTSVGDLARLADLVAVEGAAVPHDPEASLEVVR